MRARQTVVLAAAAAVLAALPAHASTPTLDGKKTKVLNFSAAASPQDNDANLVTDESGQNVPGSNPRPDDYAHCPASRCITWSFVYKPAKGVKRGPFSAKLTWSAPVEDFDLYVLDAKYGDVGHCGASFGSGEYVSVDTPVPGHKYLIVVDQYRAGPDTVKVQVSFPGASFSPAAPVPGSAAGFPVACGFTAG